MHCALWQECVASVSLKEYDMIGNRVVIVKALHESCRKSYIVKFRFVFSCGYENDKSQQIFTQKELGKRLDTVIDS